MPIDEELKKVTDRECIDAVMGLIVQEFDQDSPAVINHSMYSIKHSDVQLQHYDIVTYLDQLKYRLQYK